MEKQHSPHNRCKACNSTNTYGMSRVVGYYSIIENWNGSKQAELRDRQKGYYKIGETVGNKIQEEQLVIMNEPIQV